MALEYLVSNAEHDLKVRFNNLLMSNSEFDGRRVKTGTRLKYSPYSDAMVRKYFSVPEI